MRSPQVGAAPGYMRDRARRILCDDAALQASIAHQLAHRLLQGALQDQRADLLVTGKLE